MAVTVILVGKYPIAVISADIHIPMVRTHQELLVASVDPNNGVPSLDRVRHLWAVSVRCSGFFKLGLCCFHPILRIYESARPKTCFQLSCAQSGLSMRVCFLIRFRWAVTHSGLASTCLSITAMQFVIAAADTGRAVYRLSQTAASISYARIPQSNLLGQSFGTKGPSTRRFGAFETAFVDRAPAFADRARLLRRRRLRCPALVPALASALALALFPAFIATWNPAGAGTTGAGLVAGLEVSVLFPSWPLALFPALVTTWNSAGAGTAGAGCVAGWAVITFSSWGRTLIRHDHTTTTAKVPSGCRAWDCRVRKLLAAVAA